MFKRIVRTQILLAALVLFPLSGWSQIGGVLTDFPDAGCDQFYSLGVFKVAVHIKFVPLLDILAGVASLPTSGSPSWNHGTQRFVSPVLFDFSPTSIVARSSPHEDDHTNTGGSDYLGVTVGDAACTTSTVGDQHALLRPTGFDVDGRAEIHTEIRSFKLGDHRNDGGVASTSPGTSFEVRAGIGHGLPRSTGEVQSNQDDADFPASSFFDVFVEVDIPVGPGIITTLYNRSDEPLLIFNDNVTDLPPKVVYIHGNSSAVALYFKEAGSSLGTSWAAGEFFGFLTLAGHGASFENNKASEKKGASIQGDIDDFLTALDLDDPAKEMPFDPDRILPVELVSFNLSSIERRVRLNWATGAELDNVGFEVYRANTADTTFQLIASYLTDASLKGMGTSSQGKQYSYTDGTNSPLSEGISYGYRVVDVASDGSRKVHAPKWIRVEDATDVEGFDFFRLYPIAPNPATNEISVNFSLAESSTINLGIYSSDGELVKNSLNQQTFSAGGHTETISTVGIASGTYIVRLGVGNRVKTQRFVITR